MREESKKCLGARWGFAEQSGGGLGGNRSMSQGKFRCSLRGGPAAIGLMPNLFSERLQGYRAR